MVAQGLRVSHIASGEREIGAYIDATREEVNERVNAILKKRLALRNLAAKAGLRIFDWDDKNIAVDDLKGVDDAGRLIECNFKVRVKSPEEVQKAIRFCKENNLLGLPIGAKTSALGVFEAFSTADKRGLSGVVGIQMEDIFAMEGFSKEGAATAESTLSKEAALLKIPSFDEGQYELIRESKYPIALLKSKTFPEDPKKPHRILAHAGMRVVDAWAFLETYLGNDERYQYKIMPDPTSKAEAQLGGVVSTGAEGGNRAKAAEDISSINIVDGNGDGRVLDREQSQLIIGLNGNAGLITQVEFEVTASPKHDHAVWIPVSGKGQEAWKNMMKIQDRLKAHCKPVNGDRRLHVGPGEGGLIVTGMEPLSATALDIAKSHVKDSDITPGLDGEEFGLYVTFSSFHSEQDFEALFKEEFFTKGLGLDELTDESFDEGGNIATPRAKTHNRIKYLEGPVRHKMDEVRHGAPAASREKAKSLGDVTSSTDLNIRIETEDESKREDAMNLLSALFHEYSTAFPEQNGFQVPVYGHMHPGSGEGGGIDPHIRVIFELSNPGSRYDAPEQVIGMKKKQRDLYRKLLALDGECGIRIHAPEKSRFTTAEYWEWLCLTSQEEARKYLNAVKEYGYSKDEEGNPDRPIIGARVPHELPGLLDRLPGGIRSLFNEALIRENGDGETGGLNPLLKRFWPAILEISQFSHRGGTIKKLFGEVTRTMHEAFHLSEDQYTFFIEDPSEAELIVERNFGEGHKYKIEHVEVSLEALSTLHLEDKADTFYVLDITGLGLPKGLSVLVAPHASILDAYKKTVSGDNKAAFRNLYSMWQKWPYETDETPNIPAVASLGLVLQAGDLEGQRGVERTYPVVTTNPGPGQIHEAVMEGAGDLFERCPELMSPEGQRETIEMLQDYLGVPREHKVAVFTSATQIMQVMAAALKGKLDRVKIQQVTNDSFSDRLYEILTAELGKGGVARIATPWTTGEHSQLDSVVDGLIQGMESGKRNLIFVTPHKTSTTADFHPDVLVKALFVKGKVHGRDYELICDVTSGVGARDYATVQTPDTGGTRVRYPGQFGSFQKGMGQAPGFAVASFSPQLAELLTGSEDEKHLFGLKRSLEASAAGNVVSPLGLGMLRQKLESDAQKARTPAGVQEETLNKLALVMGWLERHPDLLPLVPDAVDRSPLLVGIFSQAKNLTVAKRILAEMGYIVGGGYGPFDKESLRIYLPTVSEDQLKGMLAALDRVLDLPDVVDTRGERIPNVALREPHDPLHVLERLGSALAVDDIFRDSVGLHWLERLAKTYNAGDKVSAKDEVDLGGVILPASEGFEAKAQIYHHPGNLAGMQGIFSMVDEDSHLPLGHYYAQYLDAENHIRALLKRNPDVQWNDPDAGTVTAQLNFYLIQAQDVLQHVARLLRKFVAGNGTFPPAPRDKQGRVAWPLAA